jgi:Fe-S-cluster-containing dehydrogenase component
MFEDLTRMVLNPDVVTRSRGVIEKCSFCVQRIQEGKLVAKKENRTLKDGDVKTACQTACPTNAITSEIKIIKKVLLQKHLIKVEETTSFRRTTFLISSWISSKVRNKDEEPARVFY